MNSISFESVNRGFHNFLNSNQFEKRMISAALAAIAAVAISHSYGASLTILATISVISTVTIVSLYVAKHFFPKKKSGPKKIESEEKEKIKVEYKQVQNLKKDVPPKPLNEQIDYKELESYAINFEKIKEYEKEIKEGDFKNFLTFLELLANSQILIKKFDATRLLNWMFPQLYILLEKKAISDELCEKIRINFCDCKVFNSQQEKFQIVCKGDSIVSVNKMALLLASSYIRTVHFSQFDDGQKKNQLTLPEYGPGAVECLGQFLLSGNFSKPDSLETASALLNIGRIYMMPELENKAADGFSWIDVKKEITNEKQLVQFFKILAKHQAKVVDEQVFAKLQHRAFSALFKNKYGLTQPFNLINDRFTIPLNAFHLLANKDEIGNYLGEKVNTVFIYPDTISDADIEKLKLLKIQVPQEIFERITSITCDNMSHFKFEKEIIKKLFAIFPNAKTIYFTPNLEEEEAKYYERHLKKEKRLMLNPESIMKLREDFRKDIKFIFVMNDSDLPEEQTQTIYISEKCDHRIVLDFVGEIEIQNISKQTRIRYSPSLSYPNRSCDDFGGRLQYWLNSKYQLKFECMDVGNYKENYRGEIRLV